MLHLRALEHTTHFCRLVKEAKPKSDVKLLPSMLPGAVDNTFMRRFKALTKALEEPSPMDAALPPPRCWNHVFWSGVNLTPGLSATCCAVLGTLLHTVGKRR